MTQNRSVTEKAIVSGAAMRAKSRSASGARRAPRAWLAVPTGERAARLTLVGLVIALHNALELPRDAITAALGKPITGLIVFVILSVAIGLLLVALRPQPIIWRWLYARPTQIVILLLTLGAGVVGVRQIVVAFAGAGATPIYSNDGTTLDQYAAQQLVLGHNPYVTTDIISAITLYGQPHYYVTPLHRGAFATLPLTQPPSHQQIDQVFAADKVAYPNQPTKVVEFESHVSYPALSFLPLVPLVWLGLPNMAPFFMLCYLGLAALLIVASPPELRLWVGLLALGDAPFLNAAAIGDLDVLYMLLIFMAWLWRERPVASTVALGLAIAAKQLAWFYLPFYAILVWREYGWRAAVKRLAGAGAIFAAINGPFIVANPRAWLSGVLAPQVDPMFPAGNGLVRLSLSGALPLFPASVYTALEALAILACVAWYWRYGKDQPEIGFALATVPLFFAWRSLTTYFYFAALPAVGLLLARQWRAGRAAAPSQPGAAPPTTGQRTRRTKRTAQTRQAKQTNQGTNALTGMTRLALATWISQAAPTLAAPQPQGGRAMTLQRHRWRRRHTHGE